MYRITSLNDCKRRLQCKVLGIALTLLALCQTPTLQAAGLVSELSAGTQYALPSEVLQETRAVLVSLPADYDFSTNRYPVLYVLDAEKSFRSVSAMAQFLGEAGKIPKMIVVGIANTDRERDFAPPSRHPDARRQIPATGEGQASGAETFARFLRTELIPWVDLRYRTVDWRALHGHSLGGLMNFYMLVHEPGLFQAHLAASASLWWDRRAYVQQAISALSETGHRTWLFFATGDREQEITEASRQVAQGLERNANARLVWRYQYYPSDDHASTPHRTALDGLEFIFARWRLEGGERGERRAGALAQHRERLHAEYGFAPAIAALDILAHGVHSLRANDFEAALGAQEQWEASYPNHPLASFFYGRLALLYAQKNMPEQARQAYQRAQDRRPQAKGFDGGRYQDIQAELQQAMRDAVGIERQ